MYMYMYASIIGVSTYFFIIVGYVSMPSGNSEGHGYNIEGETESESGHKNLGEVLENECKESVKLLPLLLCVVTIVVTLALIIIIIAVFCLCPFCKRYVYIHVYTCKTRMIVYNFVTYMYVPLMPGEYRLPSSMLVNANP